MAVRAKMYVSEVKRAAYNPDAVSVTLNCVARGEENKAWAHATPSGTVTLQVMNPEAAQQFVEAFDNRREWYVTFEPAPEV